ncbi:uncharacterized protein METZ01_LOCUS362381, partial [marine metagenome]
PGGYLLKSPWASSRPLPPRPPFA